MLLASPAAVTFSARRDVQRDLLVMPALNRCPSEVDRLTLAVEIISRDTKRTDRAIKRALFKSEGVPEHWIVDANACTVERWKPDSTKAEVLATSLTWRTDTRFYAQMIDLVECFSKMRVV